MDFSKVDTPYFGHSSALLVSRVTRIARSPSALVKRSPPARLSHRRLMTSRSWISGSFNSKRFPICDVHAHDKESRWMLLIRSEPCIPMHMKQTPKWIKMVLRMWCQDLGKLCNCLLRSSQTSTIIPRLAQGKK